MLLLLFWKAHNTLSALYTLWSGLNLHFKSLFPCMDVLVIVWLLWVAMHENVEVTLLTLRDVLHTSSYETLRTHEFTTPLANLRKQLWWNFGVGNDCLCWNPNQCVLQHISKCHITLTLGWQSGVLLLIELIVTELSIDIYFGCVLMLGTLHLHW